MVKQGLILTAALAAAAAVQAADIDLSKLPPPSDKKDLTYAKDVRPLFEKHCFKCHGEDKQKGKLRLDSLAAVKKGSEDGEVVIAGKSAKSPLVQAVSGLDPDETMPPDGKGEPLTKEQIGLIRAWIDQGAK